MDPINLIFSFAKSFGFLLVAMTVHEFAHCLVAFKLGDNTAKNDGRLTLNPLAHLDPFWTVFLPLALFLSTSGNFVFGSAKPVPINYRFLKNPKRDIIWISLAGPAANLILALLAAQIIRSFSLSPALFYIFSNLLAINVVLAVFNLIPIPPLDGSRILLGLLPSNLSRQYAGFERYGFIILFIFIWTGVFDRMLWPAVGLVIGLMGGA